MKLMIVDDEYIVRRGMKKIIQWEELNVTIAGEAETAEEAVETARRVLPDIVICDICLPGMDDGFHVIEEVRRIVPWVQFIMITAHSDAAYIRRAIHEQVCDYLYKPAQVEDIKSAVVRASVKVNDYMDKMHYDLQYRNFMMDNMDILREKFINQLIFGMVTEEKARQESEFLKINLPGPYWRIMIMQTESEPAYAALQQLALVLESWRPVITRLELDACGILLILNCRDAEDTDIMRACDKMPDIQQIRLSPLCMSFTELIGIGIRMRGKSGSKRDLPGETLTVELRRARENLYEAVKYHDSAAEMEKRFTVFIAEMQKKGYSKGKILQECRNIMDTVCMLSGIQRDGVWETADVEQLQTHFAALCQRLHQERKSPTDSISGKVLYYLRNRYREDLSLEQTAAEMFLSASYLSRMLKEQTGHGFGYWLNYYRIEAAKEMLRNTAESVEQVAEICGYHSYRIFSENFRKYTGKTASAWRLNEKET